MQSPVNGSFFFSFVVADRIDGAGRGVGVGGGIERRRHGIRACPAALDCSQVNCADTPGGGSGGDGNRRRVAAGGSTRRPRAAAQRRNSERVGEVETKFIAIALRNGIAPPQQHRHPRGWTRRSMMSKLLVGQQGRRSFQDDNYVNKGDLDEELRRWRRSGLDQRQGHLPDRRGRRRQDAFLAASDAALG